MKRTPLNMVNRFAPVACAALLASIIMFGGIDADSVPGAEEYRAAVKDSIEKVPWRVGRWIGAPLDTPPAAVKLLKPNKILQRRYVDPGSAESFTLLIVHCSDTRDMVGHYPPVCYPAHGWLAGPSRTVVLDFAGARYPAKDYDFSRIAQGGEQRLAIFSFFVLPGGAIVPDMEAVNRAAGRRSASQLGAAQIQITGGEDLPEEERRRAIDEFVSAIEPTIRVIAEGAGHG